MKLKDVTHVEKWGEKKMVDKFDIHSNRFLLFDKLGRELNEWSIKRLPNYLELEVLETKKSGYSGYGVGFPVTHIKLDFLDNSFVAFGNFHFGDYDTRL